MKYPVAQQLQLPLEPYELKDGVYRFGTRVRSRVILWARHLGDDIVVSPATRVCSIGSGKVVWSGIRAGSAMKKNWGGLIVLEHEHRNPNDQIPMTKFYSVYGHITDLKVRVGEHVQMGQEIGAVASGNTPENGWWKIPHLHFGIYVGPWTGEILSGYKRLFDGRTKFKWWRDPLPFIKEYNKS
jgi:murein DD-endopeptidase MepM/ murein hydrolase activator NlpD